MERGKLYSKRLNAGKRTYFFEVKKGRDGTSYLVITERTGYRRHSLMVFEDRLEDFLSALQEAVGKMKRV